jgi:DNA-binding transcriptional ArsR family regulator
MDELLAAMKALSDGSRLRTVMALRSGELCVCQLTELLRLAPSTVSRHMAVLRHAGLVKSRREGRWIRYGLAEEGRSPCVEALLKTAFEQLSGDPVMTEDKRRAREIRKTMTCGPDGRCGSC